MFVARARRTAVVYIPGTPLLTLCSSVRCASSRCPEIGSSSRRETWGDSTLPRDWFNSVQGECNFTLSSRSKRIEMCPEGGLRLAACSARFQPPPNRLLVPKPHGSFKLLATVHMLDKWIVEV